MQTDDPTTQQPPCASAPGAPVDHLVLTIASHPSSERLGERALLLELAAGHGVHLSRSSPDFSAPGKAWGEPLQDPFLSRRPLKLSSPGPGSVLLEVAGSGTPVAVEGKPVEDRRTFSRRELEQGVLLDLAGRVLLLLRRSEVRERSTADGHGIVGASAEIARLRASIDRIADLEVAVLLRGETGTGKELAARAIHRSSPRSEAPFIAVNLGAIPPSLAAAELFGSVAGAFTGSVKGQAGYFRAAQGGTLFLDEVGEAPPEVQVMLLRCLESGEIFPVGSQRPVKVDARLVAATDADLEARVEAGEFKAPLLHRLSAYEIALAPLRSRPEDIPLLLHHFARRELAVMGGEELLRAASGASPPWLPTDLAACLLRYSWPGNVRQLRNVIRQLLIDNRGREQLRAAPRFEALLEGRHGEPAGREAPPAKTRRPMDIPREELEEALRGHRFEPAAAARVLGISRPSLYNLIRRHPSLRLAEDLGADEIQDALHRNGGDVGEAARRLEVSPQGLRRRITRLQRS